MCPVAVSRAAQACVCCRVVTSFAVGYRRQSGGRRRVRADERGSDGVRQDELHLVADRRWPPVRRTLGRVHRRLPDGKSDGTRHRTDRRGSGCRRRGIGRPCCIAECELGSVVAELDADVAMPFDGRLACRSAGGQPAGIWFRRWRTASSSRCRSAPGRHPA